MCTFFPQTGNMQVVGVVWLDLQTEDRNIHQCKKEEVKSLDLTSEGEKNVRHSFDHTNIHTHSGWPWQAAAISDYTCVSSEQRPRARELGLCCEKQGEATLQEVTSHQGVLTLQGMGPVMGGERDLSHPSLTRSLCFSFVRWFCTVPLPPVAVISRLHTLFCYCWVCGLWEHKSAACKIKTGLPIAKIREQLWVPRSFPLYVDLEVKTTGLVNSGSDFGCLINAD